MSRRLNMRSNHISLRDIRDGCKIRDSMCKRPFISYFVHSGFTSEMFYAHTERCIGNANKRYFPLYHRGLCQGGGKMGIIPLYITQNNHISSARISLSSYVIYIIPNVRGVATVPCINHITGTKCVGRDRKTNDCVGSNDRECTINRKN